MQNLNNNGQQSQLGMTITELTILIQHYRDEAERARRLATSKITGNNAVKLLGHTDREVDAGLEFDLLADKFDKALRKMAIAKLEEDGLHVPLAQDTTIKDTEGNDVKKESAAVESVEEEIEDEEIEEVAKKLIDLDLTFDKKKELVDLWTGGEQGKIIEGEITDKDRENPEIVIETRGGEGKEHKRSLHGKEKAYRLFDEYMKEIVPEDSPLSRQDKKTQIAAVVGEVKRLEKENAAKDVQLKLEELKVTENRTLQTSFSGEDLLKRHSEFIVGDEFNSLILLGVDKKDESIVPSEDIVKLQAIRLKTVGEEGRAVSLLQKFYSKQGFTQEIARQFLYKLMQKDPHSELKTLILNVLKHHQLNAKKDQKEIAWRAGIPTAISLLKAYTRKFKVDSDGNQIMEEKDGKQVNAFLYWNDSKITNFINKCIQQAEKANLIPTGAFEAYQKSLLPKKSEDSEESVSQKNTETDGKKEGEDKTKTPSNSEQGDAKTNQKEQSEKSDAEEKETGSKAADNPNGDTENSEEPIVEFNVTTSHGKFLVTIPGVDDFAVRAPRENQVKNKAEKAFMKRWEQAQKMIDKGKAEKALALPASVAGLKFGDKVKIVYVASNTGDKK